VAVGQEHHGRVALTLAVFSSGGDEAFHFGRDEVFSCSQLGIWRTAQGQLFDLQLLAVPGGASAIAVPRPAKAWWGWGPAVAGGVVAGAIVGGALAPWPYYPPPYYYRPYPY
jgi:hypothetical protein